MTPRAWVHAVGTASPAHRVPQARLLDFALRHGGLDARAAALAGRVAEAGAVDSRASVLPDFGREPADFEFFPKNEDLSPTPSTAARNAVFAREAPALALQAVRDLFAKLPPGTAERVTRLVTASCTGFSAPGFDYTLIRDLPLSPRTARAHLGFMGCFAAFPALRAARDAALADPGSLVLVVAVELCTLHFMRGVQPDVVVGNLLFADGAAAALVSADPALSSGPRFGLDAFATTIIPGSTSDIAWTLGDTGFEMRLSAYVPRLLGTTLGPAIQPLLAGTALAHRDFGRWAIHPGGRAILDKVGEGFSLPPAALAHSYRVLREHGNMSSATEFFVLERLLERDDYAGPVLAAAFGPGLTIEAARLELVR